jgi:hypothetical protein
MIENQVEEMKLKLQKDFELLKLGNKRDGLHEKLSE